MTQQIKLCQYQYQIITVNEFDTIFIELGYVSRITTSL